jgi:glyoxylate/hydroxypyruvate reductase A
MSTVLVAVTPILANAVAPALAAAGHRVVRHGHDAFSPDEIDCVVSFRPPHGLLRSLPNLRCALSLGAGVDGFLSDPEYPQHVPLVRFVDPTLSQEMAQFVVMHVLLQHRRQRFFDDAQAAGEWRQIMLPRRTEDTRVGILGMGEIGGVCAGHLVRLGFSVRGWSRSGRAIEGVNSFAGEAEREAFLAGADILVCLLPLTPDTRGILGARLFARLPQGAFVINVARGGHLVDEDLIAALESGHLSGAVLDVFHTEPLPASSPLWRHPKVVVTPHIAAITDPAAGVASVLESLRRLESGEPFINVVDTARGY